MYSRKEILQGTDKALARRQKRLDITYRLVSLVFRYVLGRLGDIDMPKIMAKIINDYRFKDDSDHAITLYLNWLNEKVIEDHVLAMQYKMEFIYEYLVNHGHGVNNREGHGNGDVYSYFVPTDNNKLKVFATENQNLQFLTIINSGISKEVHIRRFWESSNNKEHYALENWLDDSKITLNKVLKDADWIIDIFSDNLEGEKYIKRPDLQYFIDAKFKPKYGDGRDCGCIFSHKEFLHETNFSFRDINTAMFDIQTQYDYFKQKESEVTND
jgi:hypothetical protein